MTIIFNELVKHSGQQFLPGVAVAFADCHAEDYFQAMGWAGSAGTDPVHTYPEGTVQIDLAAVFGHGPNKGALVLPEPAQEV